MPTRDIRQELLDIATCFPTGVPAFNLEAPDDDDPGGDIAIQIEGVTIGEVWGTDTFARACMGGTDESVAEAAADIRRTADYLLAAANGYPAALQEMVRLQQIAAGIDTDLIAALDLADLPVVDAAGDALETHARVVDLISRYRHAKLLAGLVVSSVNNDKTPQPVEDGDPMPAALSFVCRILIDQLEACGKENYLSWGCSLPTGKHYHFHVAHAKGKSPAMLVEEARVERDLARAERDLALAERNALRIIALARGST